MVRLLRKGFRPWSGFRSTKRSSLVRIVPANPATNKKCVICSGRMQDTTYLNPCNHRFCFSCIQKWSRTKTTCPLCRGHFYSFFHKVSKKGTLCEYVLPLRDNFYSENGEDHNPTSTQRPTSPPDDGIVCDEVKGTLNQRAKDLYQLMKKFALTDNYTNIDVVSLGRFKAQAVIEFRRALYHAGILVQNVQNTDFNQSPSPEFFSRNHGSFDRLIPWLKRELRVLCGNQRPLVDSLQNLILDNMTQLDLQSKEFEALLEPYLHRFTTHFLHEFISFVQSPLSMRKYDWIAAYELSPPAREEDSDSFISTPSSDIENSQEPDGNQTSQAHSNLDDDSRCLHCVSDEKLTTVLAIEDGGGHSSDKENVLENLSNSDAEEGPHSLEIYIKNKPDTSQQDQKVEKVESLSYSQSLQCNMEKENVSKLSSDHTYSSIHAEASDNFSNTSTAEDNNTETFNPCNASGVSIAQNSTKEGSMKWQQSEFPISHFRHCSLERRSTSLPSRKRAFRKSSSRSMGYSFEEFYSISKGAYGRNQARHQHDGRQHTAGCRDRKTREQGKSTPRDMSLFQDHILTLKNEVMGGKETNKMKAQNFQKLGNKDYAYLGNKFSHEPSWKYFYQRHDNDRSRYVEPLFKKSELTRVYGPKSVGSTRERPCLTPENKTSIKQGRKVLYSERCKSTGKPRAEFFGIGQERGPYDLLGGKRRCRSHLVESGHSRGRHVFVSEQYE